MRASVEPRLAASAPRGPRSSAGPAADARLDAELLSRMTGGDEQALGLLYDRWSDRVFSLAAYLLGDDHSAADVVEETFWRAWRTASEYSFERGTVGTWLLLLARSRALEQLRTARRREIRLTSLVARASPVEENPVLDEVESNERRAIVTRALEGLPTEQLRVVELAFFRGLTHAEIAAHTEQPLGTVKTRIRLGLDKLRECLSFLREEDR